MTWLQFVSALVSDLAWPAFIAGSAYIMRQPISDALKALRVSKLKFGGVEAEFSDRLGRVENELLDTDAGEAIEDQPPTSKMYRSIDISPKFAILAAWLDIEELLLQLAEIEQGIDRGQVQNGRRNTSDFRLYKMTVSNLPKNMQHALDELRNIRNQIAHHSEFEMRSNDVEKYVDIAADVMSFLKKKIRSL